MKTAITLPDELIERADRFAKERGLSRSELVNRALEDYLKLRDDAAITQSYNEVYKTEPSSIEPALIQAQIRAVGKEDW